MILFSETEFTHLLATKVLPHRVADIVSVNGGGGDGWCRLAGYTVVANYIQV